MYGTRSLSHPDIIQHIYFLKQEKLKKHFTLNILIIEFFFFSVWQSIENANIKNIQNGTFWYAFCWISLFLY